MKKQLYKNMAFLIALLTIGAINVHGQTPVEDWGLFARYGGWLYTPGTNPGDATLSGSAAPSPNWAVIRGGFADTLTATVEQAVVVTGSITFNGGGATSWNAMRWGLFNHDSAGVLIDTTADSTHWNGVENQANGYTFLSHSGTNEIAGWANGGSGTQGVVRNSSWLSTFGNNLAMGGAVNQAPARAEISQGTYDFAISVKPNGDGTNDVRYYFIEEGTPPDYWIGGIFTDTTGITDTFNGVVFGINNGNGIAETGMTGITLTGVNAGLGNPITLPEKPWSDYYIDQWGLFARNGGWKLDTSAVAQIIGNAGLHGTTSPTPNWAVIRGGFIEPVTATTEEAIIIEGSIEFIGGGATSWNAMRWGLFNHDSAGVLIDTTADSTHWNGVENQANGYTFLSHSGTNEIAGWANGGSGTQGVVRNSSWLSTFGNNLAMGGAVNQAPARAEISQGTYDFAISVKPNGDGTNDVRYYFIEEGTPPDYWIGGIFTDTTGITDTFNGVVFGINNGNGIAETGMTGINLRDVEVKRGQPITLPEKPWSDYYIDQWGIFARYGGWRIDTSAAAQVIGNAGLHGSSAPSPNWAVIRGGFYEPHTATTENALIVTGEIEFIGGGPTVWSGLRMGIFNHDSAGVLIDTTADSTHWNGVESMANGYMFIPHNGSNEIAGWANGGNGTQGVVRNSSWISTFGNNLAMGVVNQAPARAEMPAGVYEFAISVQPNGDGTNEVRFYIQEDSDPVTYWFGGIFTDTTGITTTFNGICFGIINTAEITTTGINLRDVNVDRGAPIDIPIPPFSDFYVGDWGFIGGRTGGWSLTPGQVIGNAIVSGASPADNWAAIRGGFPTPVYPTSEEDGAIIITAEIEFENGGFEAWSGLRFGLFNSSSAGNLQFGGTDSSAWSGDEVSNGYLFIPRSGTNDIPAWSGAGGNANVGAVVNSSWISTNGADNYILGDGQFNPVEGVAGAGTYTLEMSIHPQSDGSNDIRFVLLSDDETYGFAGHFVDNSDPIAANVFNGLNFALNSGLTTTSMSLADVHVDMGAPITLPDWVTSIAENPTGLPTQYALSQNYPNPFNPSTSIQIALPQNSEVDLKLYDISGRLVGQLAKGNYNAGYHTINFNASNLASGVYFYRLEADKFVSVKKLMLLK